MPQPFGRRDPFASKKSEPAASGQPAAAACPQCGSQAAQSTPFCQKCGYRLTPANPEPQQQTLATPPSPPLPPAAPPPEADRARFTEERDFYRPVPPPPQLTATAPAPVVPPPPAPPAPAFAEGATVIEHGFRPSPPPPLPAAPPAAAPPPPSIPASTYVEFPRPSAATPAPPTLPSAAASAAPAAAASAPPAGGSSYTAIEPDASGDQTMILRAMPVSDPTPPPLLVETQERYQGPLAFLVERNGPNAGKAHLLMAETYVGRAPECDVSLPNSAVSKRHARIRFQGDKFVYWDLASANFSFTVAADGERTRILDPLELVDGQTIDLGDARLTFLWIAASDQG